MASIQRDTSINKYQDFVGEVYGLNNDRYFSVGDMLTHNSTGINLAEELSLTFSENCHACKKSPCQCSFLDIMGFKS